MDESESKNEKPQKKRGLDPELLKKGLRCDLDQYDMLKRCSDKNDMTEWNQWREKNPNEDILLQGKDLSEFWLKNANFMYGKRLDSQTKKTIDFSGEVHFEEANFENAVMNAANFRNAHLEHTCFWYADARDARFPSAHLENAKLGVAHFEGCDFCDAVLENVDFSPSFLNGAKFTDTDLRGCRMRGCVVDGATRFWNCQFNQYSESRRFTDLSGTSLASAIVYPPGAKSLLEYNIRRMNWEYWYPKQHWLLRWLVRKFWQISDYGISTKLIIRTFFKWALVFAAVYYIWGFIDYYFMGIKDYPGMVSDLFVLEDNQEVVSCWLVPFRSVYFSIVTMTTLGFGDMYANAHSFLRGLFGHALLALQVILGYVLLGALITRFAVLFTAGGPAGKFTNENKRSEK